MTPRIGEFAAMRHGELMGNLVDHVTVASQNRKGRNLA
jgi:hypothetical protein